MPYPDVTTVVDADGNYGDSPLFKVPADDPGTGEKEGGVNGDIVKFYVLEQLAGQAVFAIDGTTQLNLIIEVPPGEPPIVRTWPPDSVRDTSARLRGKLVDLGSAASVDFSYEWGTTTAYDNETLAQNMTAPGTFFFNLGSLTPGTTYHYRTKGVGDGTGYGLDRTFTTGAPIMRTWPAFGLTNSSVRLRGKLVDLGLASSAAVSFEWGTTMAYGNETPAQNMTAPGTFFFNLGSLTPGTTYYYRAKGVGSGVGTGYGYSQTFVPGMQMLLTWRADRITDISARLRGKLLDLGLASSVDVSFEWGTTTAYGNETPVQNMTVPGASHFNLEGLTLGTTYYYRIKGVSDVGTRYGGRKTFIAAPAPPP